VRSVLIAVVSAAVGAAAGWFVRWGSVKLARWEELEPGASWWQRYSPPILSAALLGIFGYELSGSLALLALRSVFVLVLVQIFYFDFEHRLILDRVIFPAMFLALVVSLFNQPWWAGLASGLSAGLLFVLLGLAGSWLMKAEALGLGDVKLAVFIGLVLGPLPTIHALFLGVVLAGLVSIGYAIWRRSLEGSIALGPFLAAGTVVVLYQIGLDRNF
jgi:leader peptidase (prepilin peptidase) / N-methyltransferase